MAPGRAVAAVVSRRRQGQGTRMPAMMQALSRAANPSSVFPPRNRSLPACPAILRDKGRRREPSPFICASRHPQLFFDHSEVLVEELLIERVPRLLTTGFQQLQTLSQVIHVQHDMVREVRIELFFTCATKF